MSGFLQEPQDISNQNYANTGLANIFNYGLSTGQQGQQTGQSTLNRSISTLGTADQYFKNLLTAGRTQTAQNAAPAIQTAVGQGTTARNQQAQFGTGRTGGTAAGNQQQQTNTNASIDSIISSTLNTQKQQGAQGELSVAGAEASIGSTELSAALANLGLSESAVQSILSGNLQGQQISAQESQGLGLAIGRLLAAA